MLAKLKHKIKKACKNPRHIITFVLSKIGVLRLLSDKSYLKLNYWAVFGKKLNLDNPATYNEKLQWLKLYDRNPEYTKMVDKYEVKKIVADIIGEEHIIPTLGVWDSFDEIDFESLPQQFVLKCTHDSGGLVICKDKQSLDINAARKKLNKSLRKNYFYDGREWPYKNLKPRIIAEEYMQDVSSNNADEIALTDYKFFCFSGVPEIVYVSKDKSDNPRTDFFDMEFNHLPIKMRDPNSDIPPQKPEHFDEMKNIAMILSKDFPHVRVDLYKINGEIYFGEMTFYHCSGFTKVKPHEWNIKMGNLIKLPETNIWQE